MASQVFIGIADVIHTVARREDSELRRFSEKGIFSIPELALVHAVAKELSSRPSEIFGVPKIKWEMNRSIGAGLTDLIINAPNDDQEKYAIEFKLGGEIDKWKADIDKLSKIHNQYNCIFCALADVFVSDLATHSRFMSLDKDPRIERIVENFDFFSTVSAFKTQTCCVVGLWKFVT